MTLSMKNCFGITPCTIYSQEAPEDEPGVVPMGYRGPMHSGSRVPPKSAPQPVAESTDPGFRVPRITADLVAARPIYLAVIDGIYTMTGGELPNQEKNWIHQPVHPGLLIAGLNCVATDAVATAVMGFDPMADPARRRLKHATARCAWLNIWVWGRAILRGSKSWARRLRRHATASRR